MPPSNDGPWGYGNKSYVVPTDAYTEEMVRQPIVNLTTGTTQISLYDIKYPNEQEKTTFGDYNKEEYNEQMVNTLNKMTPPESADKHNTRANEHN